MFTQAHPRQHLNTEIPTSDILYTTHTLKGHTHSSKLHPNPQNRVYTLLTFVILITLSPTQKKYRYHDFVSGTDNLEV